MKKILITDRAGFPGSHLCERLLANGHDILCVDNFFICTKVTHLMKCPNFELVRHGYFRELKLAA